MQRTPQESGWHRLVHARILHLGIAALLLVVTVSFGREVVRRYEVSQEIRGLRAQLGDLEKQKTQLSGLINYFNSPLFQEEEARGKLGLAKPGESVVIVPITNNVQQQTATTTIDQSSNPKKWWNYFFATNL